MKEVYDEKVQHDVVGPVFCIDYPREVSPLARAHRDDPAYVERFELIVAGFELCNAYCEQNDPVEQLAAFEDEARAKAGGDPEAGDIDLDYVRALEYGMPLHRRARHRHRPAGDAAGQRRLDPRGHPVPDAAPRVRPGPAAGRGGAPRPVLPPTPAVPAAAAPRPGADGAAPAGSARRRCRTLAPSRARRSRAAGGPRRTAPAAPCR